MDNQKRLFEQIIGLLRAEFGDDLLGVLVTGSRVYGVPGPTSDLDVYVIIAPARRQRRNIILEGVEVEMFINPPFQIRRYMADMRGVDPHMFTFGWTVYDPRGVVAGLQAEARAIWEAGPPPIKDTWLHRYAPANLLRDLEDVAPNDEATANALIARIVEQLIETHGRLNQRWTEKLKRRFDGLERWDARAARLARTTLSCEPLSVRRAALDQFAAHVLAPLGGLMPLEWHTEWEELQE